MSPVDLFTFCRVKILTYSLKITKKKKKQSRYRNKSSKGKWHCTDILIYFRRALNLRSCIPIFVGGRMAIATQVLANRKTKITDSCATRIFAFPRKKKNETWFQF